MLAMTRVFVVVLDASFDLHNLASKEWLLFGKRVARLVNLLQFIVFNALRAV